MPVGGLAAQSVNILFQGCLPPSRLHAPISLGGYVISPRTVMNNADLPRSLKPANSPRRLTHRGLHACNAWQAPLVSRSEVPASPAGIRKLQTQAWVRIKVPEHRHKSYDDITSGVCGRGRKTPLVSESWSRQHTEGYWVADCKVRLSGSRPGGRRRTEHDSSATVQPQYYSAERFKTA